MAKPYISLEKRRLVIDRAAGRCEYCQSRADYATETFAVEHITPTSRAGTNALDNLALSCSGCNGYKLDHVVADTFHLDCRFYRDYRHYSNRTSNSCEVANESHWVEEYAGGALSHP